MVKRKEVLILFSLALLLVLTGFVLPSARRAQAGAGRAPMREAPELVGDDVLKRADEYTADWLMYAKNYRGQRFSPLNQIDRNNVARLVAWAPPAIDPSSPTGIGGF